MLPAGDFNERKTLAKEKICKFCQKILPESAPRLHGRHVAGVGVGHAVLGAAVGVGGVGRGQADEGGDEADFAEHFEVDLVGFEDQNELKVK